METADFALMISSGCFTVGTWPVADDADVDRIVLVSACDSSLPGAVRATSVFPL